MTTSAQIREAFKESVFDHADAQAISKRAFAFDAQADVHSLKEFADMFDSASLALNFFTYVTYRTRETGSIRGANTSVDRYTHTVEIDYYIEKAPEDSLNFNVAIDALETIDDLVLSQLGKSWDSLVDYGQLREFRRPQLVEIGGRKVWRAGYTYLGIKTV